MAGVDALTANILAVEFPFEVFRVWKRPVRDGDDLAGLREALAGVWDVQWEDGQLYLLPLTEGVHELEDAELVERKVGESFRSWPGLSPTRSCGGSRPTRPCAGSPSPSWVRGSNPPGRVSLAGAYGSGYGALGLAQQDDDGPDWYNDIDPLDTLLLGTAWPGGFLSAA